MEHVHFAIAAIVPPTRHSLGALVVMCAVAAAIIFILAKPEFARRIARRMLRVGIALAIMTLLIIGGYALRVGLSGVGLPESLSNIIGFTVTWGGMYLVIIDWMRRQRAFLASQQQAARDAGVRALRPGRFPHPEPPEDP
ncbi:hypothetical protein HYS28_01450 [Candidatus Uhrbacteria bacterium]|nr:hypothetical protein [Candidatus Uhrbacteria bacterium]